MSLLEMYCERMRLQKFMVMNKPIEPRHLGDMEFILLEGEMFTFLHNGLAIDDSVVLSPFKK